MCKVHQTWSFVYPPTSTSSAIHLGLGYLQLEFRKKRSLEQPLLFSWLRQLLKWLPCAGDPAFLTEPIPFVSRVFIRFFLSVSSQQLWNWCSWVANSSDFDRSSKVLCQSHCDYPDRIKIPASGWPLRPCILVRQRYRQAVLTGTWWLHRFYYLWPIRCFPAFILNIGSLTFENVSEKSGYPSPGLAMNRIGCNVGTVHELTVGLFELGLPVLTSKYRTFRCW